MLCKSNHKTKNLKQQNKENLKSEAQKYMIHYINIEREKMIELPDRRQQNQ